MESLKKPLALLFLFCFFLIALGSCGMDGTEVGNPNNTGQGGSDPVSAPEFEPSPSPNPNILLLDEEVQP